MADIKTVIVTSSDLDKAKAEFDREVTAMLATHEISGSHNLVVATPHGGGVSYTLSQVMHNDTP